jgi:hypothetical protein
MRICRCCALAVLVWLTGASVAEARQCSFILTPTTFSVESTAATRTLSIITGTQCSWTAVSAASWITVIDGATGTGIGSVMLAVAVNSTATPRTGTVTIAGQTVTVTQTAGSCAVTLTPTSFAVDAVATLRTVSVVAGTQCGWSATTVAEWLTVTSGSGAGIGSVTFRAETNTSGAARVGVVSIGGQAVTVTQAATGGGPVPPPPANLRVVR